MRDLDMFLLDRERAAVTLWERGNKQAVSVLRTQIDQEDILMWDANIFLVAQQLNMSSCFCVCLCVCLFVCPIQIMDITK